MVNKRAGWLAVLFLGEMLTATAMGYFSDEISQAVVLALFVPFIISSGGNSGSQATTLVIRAMALREIRLRDWWRVIRRELMAGIVLGSILGIIGDRQNSHLAGDLETYGEHYFVVALTVGCKPDRRGHVRHHRRLHAAVYLARADWIQPAHPHRLSLPW